MLILVGAVLALFVLCAGTSVVAGVTYFLLQRGSTPLARQRSIPALADAAIREKPSAPAETSREKPAPAAASQATDPAPAEQAPAPEKLADKAIVGKPFRYTLPAANPALRYEMVSGPPGMGIGGREIIWLPDTNVRGLQEFSVRADDGNQVKLLRYQVEVVAAAPVQPGVSPAASGTDGLLKDQSTLPVKALIGRPFSFQFPNPGGAVKYELLPGFKQRFQGMDLSSEGLLTWTSPVGSPGLPLLLTVMVNGRLTVYRLEIEEDSESTLALEVPGGWVMRPDGVTLIVSLPDKAQLVFVDTLTNKESKRVNLDFKPRALALQGQALFAAAEGSGQLYVVDAATGAVKKDIRVSEAPLLALACHPEKGPVYASNSQKQIWAVDPASGRATDTHAQGMFVAVDPVQGDAVYTGIQGEIKDVIVIRKVGGDRFTLQRGSLGERAVLLKYAVKEGGLEPVGANDNAAANGQVLRVSPDGKRVGIVGGGGYLPPAGGAGANMRDYVIALFNTDDVKAMAGKVACGGYPTNLAFHPALDLGVAEQAGGPEAKLHLFRAKALNEIDTIPFREMGTPVVSPDQLTTGLKAEEAHLLTFGGRGTKLVYYDGRGSKPYLRFLPLKLSDQDKEALAKAYGK